MAYKTSIGPLRAPFVAKLKRGCVGPSVVDFPVRVSVYPINREYLKEVGFVDHREILPFRVTQTLRLEIRVRSEQERIETEAFCLGLPLHLLRTFLPKQVEQVAHADRNMLFSFKSQHTGALSGNGESKISVCVLSYQGRPRARHVSDHHIVTQDESHQDLRIRHVFPFLVPISWVLNCLSGIHRYLKGL